MFLTIVSTGIRMLAGIGSFAILARVLPFEIFELVTVGLLLGQIAAVFIDSGTNSEMLRFVGTDTDKIHEERLADSTLVRLIVLPLPILAIFCVGFIVGGMPVGQLVSLIALSSMLATINDSYFISFRARRLLKVEFFHSLFQAILLVSVPLACLLEPWMTGVFFVALRSVFLIFIAKEISLSLFGRAVLNHKIFKHYIRLKYYAFDSIFSNLSARLDSIAVLFLLGSQSLALYQPAARVYSSTLSLASIVAGLAMPVASRMKNDSRSLRYLLLYFSVAGVLLSILLFVVLVFVVGPIFGEIFSPSLLTAFLLALTVLIRFSSAGAGSFLTLCGLQKKRTVGGVLITLSTCVVLFVLDVSNGGSVEVVLGLILASQSLLTLIYLVLSYKARVNV